MSTAASTSAPLVGDGQNGSPKRQTSATQAVLGPWIRAQSLTLLRHTQALHNFTREEFGTGPEAPTEGHVQAVNKLLASLRTGLVRHARDIIQHAAAARRNPTHTRLTTLVTHKHHAHNWV